MRVRLAFAVAAHLEPEVLIIDEVFGCRGFGISKALHWQIQEIAGWKDRDFRKP